jgi:hypothetical protein
MKFTVTPGVGGSGVPFSSMSVVLPTMRAAVHPVAKTAITRRTTA